MPKVDVAGASLFYELEGEGAPIVLVHGSWGDHHAWDLVAPKLASSFRVLRFDRRGHSDSAFDGPQGVKEDLDDIAGLIRHFDLGPAHIVGNSFGASIVLNLAVRSPELFRSLCVHEPPLVNLLEGPIVERARQRIQGVVALLRAGKMEEGARIFVETVGFGPGAWQALTERDRQTYARNAKTWLDEVDDPQTLNLNLDSLRRFDKPSLLTYGDQSPPFFAPIIRRIHAVMPSSQLVQLQGVGHVPHMTRPDEWVKRLTDFVRGVPSPP
jgi:pimeloyl-ACP methyl ester carboxylesterase